MTINNWINEKVRPHVFRGQVPTAQAPQRRYQVSEPGKVGSTITSSKSLEELQAKYPTATIKPL